MSQRLEQHEQRFKCDLLGASGGDPAAELVHCVGECFSSCHRVGNRNGMAVPQFLEDLDERSSGVAVVELVPGCNAQDSRSIGKNHLLVAALLRLAQENSTARYERLPERRRSRGRGEDPGAHSVELAPHDFEEQPLLAPEMMIDSPARHRGRGRNVLEREVIVSGVRAHLTGAAQDIRPGLFGFSPTFATDWYVSLRHDTGAKGFELALLAHDHPTVPDGFGLNARGVILNFEVDDAAAEYCRLVEEAGIRPILPLRDEEFRQRHSIINDPAGNLVDVIENIEPSAEFVEYYHDGKG